MLCGDNIFHCPHVVSAARKRDAAKLSSLGCQRNDGEAKQAFVRRWGGGGVGDGSSHFLVALHWEVGSRRGVQLVSCALQRICLRATS